MWGRPPHFLLPVTTRLTPPRAVNDELERVVTTELAPLGFELVEWRNGADEPFARADGGWDDDYEGLADKFRAFLARAASCRSVFAAAAASAPPGSRTTSQVAFV